MSEAVWSKHSHSLSSLYLKTFVLPLLHLLYLCSKNFFTKDDHTIPLKGYPFLSWSVIRWTHPFARISLISSLLHSRQTCSIQKFGARLTDPRCCVTDDHQQQTDSLPTWSQALPPIRPIWLVAGSKKCSQHLILFQYSWITGQHIVKTSLL